MSAMQAATIDKTAMRATTEPGKGGSILADMLLRQGLFSRPDTVAESA